MAIKLNASVKIPRAHGTATVQKLKLVDGEFVTVEEQQADNIVLNRCMDLYLNWMNYTAGNYSNTDWSNLQAFEHMFFDIAGSDNATAVSAATTALAGNIINSQSNGVTVTDAGLIGGREYTKVTRECVFYKGALTNGYTLNKIYGVYQIISGGNGRLSKILATGSPISELLLAAPITITDIETEAVKVVYDIYFPRFGLVANGDFGREVLGSGTIAIQEKDSGGVTSVGPTTDWELVFAGHRDANIATSTSGTGIGKLSNVYSSSTGQNLGVANANNDLLNYAAEDAAVRSVVFSNPTATSAKMDVVFKAATFGDVGSSRTFYKITVLGVNNSGNEFNEGSGPAMWINFVPSTIDLDWTQTLEIHLSVTFDWT